MQKKNSRLFLLTLIFALLPTFILPGKSAPSSRKVVEITIDGMIHLGTVTILEAGLAKAKEIEAEAILIELDTPGGLLESTRDIVKLILNSEVPFIIYVGPSGARAGSAGTFITLAGHVAAMAPGTNIGAAHPVTATGKDPEKDGGEHMAKKVEEDTRAFIKTIAKQRKRNEEWAQKAVLESSSIVEDEALELNVIDLVARDKKTLLQKIDGRKVTTKSGERPLSTKNAELVPLQLDFFTEVKNFLANPTVMFVLILLAGMGFYMEMSNPGLIAPAVVAVISIVLLMVATSSIPITVIGVGLLILGFALLIAEIYVTSFGLLGIGGIVSFVIGAYLLFDPSEVGVRLPIGLIAGSALAIGSVALIIGYGLSRTFGAKQTAGNEALLGQIATVEKEITPPKKGKVFFLGEYWNATADEPLARGDEVEVVEAKGLKVHVKRKTEQTT